MIALLARIPLPVLYPVASLLAWLLDHVFKYRRRVVDDNLRTAFPHAEPATLRSIRSRFYSNLADTFVETLKALHMSSEDLTARVRIENAELLKPYVDAGTPIMLISAHLANWEWAFLRCGLELSYPLECIYRPQRSEFVDRQVRRVRTRFGAGVISYLDAFRHIMAHLKTPRATSFVVDQRPSDQEERHWTSFLEQDTPFYAGWAKLAQLTRYPVFYADLKRTARGHYSVTFVLLTEAAQHANADQLVEQFVRLLETSIKAAPADWLWSHRRWRDRKPIYA
ncbi:MAG: lysophospholipid acyltransferase family protein [Pseudomonadota bacterium]